MFFENIWAVIIVWSNRTRRCCRFHLTVLSILHVGITGCRKLEDTISGHTVMGCDHTNFHSDPVSSSLAETCGRTDRHDQARLRLFYGHREVTHKRKTTGRFLSALQPNSILGSVYCRPQHSKSHFILNLGCLATFYNCWYYIASN